MMRMAELTSSDRLLAADLASQAANDADDDASGAEPSSPEIPHDDAREPADIELRRTLLSNPKLHAAVRKVLNLRGVWEQDIEDLLHVVIKRALRNPNLPVDKPEEDLIRFVCAIARHVAIDDARARKRAPTHYDGTEPNVASAVAVNEEDRNILRVVLEKVQRRHARGVEWFIKTHGHDAPYAQIAREAGVSEGYVRHEVSTVLKTAMAIAATLGVLVIVYAYWTKQHDFSARQWTPRHPVPVLRDAEALRERARNECNVFEWQACVDDLDAANQADPAGATTELRDLRDGAQNHLLQREPPPPPPAPMPDKPPLK